MLTMAETTENEIARLLLDMRREMQDMHKKLALRLDGIAHILALMERGHRAKRGKEVPPLKAD